MNKKHNPATIAPPAGRYTTAIEVPPNARWLHISGLVGMDKQGNVPPGIEAQVENIWKNITAVLAEVGMTLDDIVKVTIFLTKPENIAPYREVRDRFMGEARPASTLVVVSSLVRPEWLCEVEAVAAKA